MNEQIRELADEAGFMDSWFSESGDDCERELKKFAELIVQECIKICSDVESDEELCGLSDGALVCMAEIKEHFGVEE